MGTQVVMRFSNSLLPTEPSVSFWCTIVKSVMMLLEFQYSSTSGDFSIRTQILEQNFNFFFFFFLLFLLVEILLIALLDLESSFSGINKIRQGLRNSSN